MNKVLQFLVYRSIDEDVLVDAIVKNEIIGLTPKGMVELFGVQLPAVSKHLKNIFKEGELNEAVVVSKIERTTQHGEYDEFNKTQKITSDFDREVKKLMGRGGKADE